MVSNLAFDGNGKGCTFKPTHIRIISKVFGNGILKCWNVAANERAKITHPTRKCHTLDLNGQSNFSNEVYGIGCGIIMLTGDVDVTWEHAKYL